MELVLAEVRTILQGEAARLPEPMPYRSFIAQARRVPLAEHEAWFRAQLGDVTEPTGAFDLLDVQGDGQRIAETRLPLPARSPPGCAPAHARGASTPRRCSMPRGRLSSARAAGATTSSSARSSRTPAGLRRRRSVMGCSSTRARAHRARGPRRRELVAQT
jgi:hypothetical protein